MRRVALMAVFAGAALLTLTADASAAPRRGGRPAIERLSRTFERHVSHRCRGEWVPGHYDVVVREVCEPVRRVRVWVPPRYETVRRHGCSIRRLVRAGHYELREVGGGVRRVRDRVWIPGHYEPCRHRHHRCG